MWYFYGRKKKIIASYPPPTHPTIVEPFAGSASYALHADNWQRRVILIERDPVLAALWRWVIHEATEQDILNFPDPELGVQTPPPSPHPPLGQQTVVAVQEVRGHPKPHGGMEGQQALHGILHPQGEALGDPGG